MDQYTYIIKQEDFKEKTKDNKRKLYNTINYPECILIKMS